MNLGDLNTISINQIDINGDELLHAVLAIPDCFGEFNSQALDVTPVDGCSEFSNTLPSQVIKFAQRVGVGIGNEVIRFAQDVEKYLQIDAEIIKFSQSISAPVSGKIASFTQIIGTTAFYDKLGYDINIVINGVLIDAQYIKGDITITKESNKAVLCEFKMGALDPYDFLYSIDGAPIIINFRDSTGWHRVFTGVIDTPEIDLIQQFILVKCSDRRDELILDQVSALLPTIGRYAQAVQGVVNNASDELSYRLQTIPSDFDFDSFNTPNLNSWYSKSIADFSLGNSQVYYSAPKVQIQSRAAVKNNIVLDIKFQYTRLYHHQRTFSWATPTDVLSFGWKVGGTADIVNYNFYRLDKGPVGHVKVGTIKSAIDSAKWKSSNFTFTDSYVDFGLQGPTIDTFSGPETDTFNYLNDDYKYLVSPPPSGSVVGSTTKIVTPPASESETRALSAQWEGSYRFSQNIIEQHNITIQAPQSIAQFGAIPSVKQVVAPQTYSLTAPFDSTSWDNYTNLSSAPSSAVHTGNSFWFNEDDSELPISTPMFTAPTSLPEFKNTLLTAIDKAKTQILASHRSTKVMFESPIIPTLELRHTINLASSKVSCKGKVTKIVHKISLMGQIRNSSAIEISLFKSRTSAITTDTVMPDRPSDAPSIPTGNVVLGNHMGQDPATTLGSSSWTGFIGNATYPYGPSVIKTAFQEKFVVTTPAIADTLTKNRNLVASSSYDIAIPNDSLDMNF